MYVLVVTRGEGTIQYLLLKSILQSQPYIFMIQKTFARYYIDVPIFMFSLDKHRKILVLLHLKLRII